MINFNQRYCLDANVLIVAWQTYYSPRLCPNYWDVLNELGKNDQIFLPEHVSIEITRTDDDLATWLKSSKIPVRKVSGSVANCLRSIYAANALHQNLVDNIKQRSLADPWVIARAMNDDACVVTKEEKVTAANSNRIKIPNVCENMNIKCINDFQMLEELKVQFSTIYG